MGAQRFVPSELRIDSGRVYSLAELIDLAKAHNPETRLAREGARAQAAALGIARSELFPTLAAVALAGLDRSEAGLGSRFRRQTAPTFQVSLNLNDTTFDFGARRGRINAERAPPGFELGFQRGAPATHLCRIGGVLQPAECSKARRRRGRKPGERTGRARGGGRASP